MICYMSIVAAVPTSLPLSCNHFVNRRIICNVLSLSLLCTLPPKNEFIIDIYDRACISCNDTGIHLYYYSHSPALPPFPSLPLSLSPSLSLPPFPSPGAEPTEPEKEVYSRISEILSDAPRILEELRAYKGAGESIREVRKLWGEGERPMYKLYSPDSFKLHPVM